MLAAPVVLGVVRPLQTLQNPAALSLRCPPLRGQMQGREAVVVADILVGSESNGSSVAKDEIHSKQHLLEPQSERPRCSGRRWAGNLEGYAGASL